MTKKVLTTDKLVNSVKRRMMLPLDQQTFTKQDIIDVLNEEMDVSLVSFLLSNHEEYLVNHINYPITSSDQSDEGNFSFKIPDRAIGNRLRRLCYVNDTGVQTQLTRVSPENLVYFQKIGYQTYSFYVENDMIKLVNKYTIANATALRMYFEMTPSALVEDKYAAVIQNINTITGQITVDQVPSNFAANTKFDFIDANSPNKLSMYDQPVINVDVQSKILTFDVSKFPSEITAGDYICAAGESIVPQIPTELHPMLAQMAAVALLESLGDQQAIQIAAARLQKMKETTVDLIDNRVEGSNLKVNNFGSPLSQSRIRYRRSYW